jgi:proline iminopeptidase
MPDKVKCLGLLIILFCCILDYSIAQETDKMVDINGAKIFCKTLGDGEPLVIVHGGPGLAHDYLFGPFKQLSDN